MSTAGDPLETIQPYLSVSLSANLTTTIVETLKWLSQLHLCLPGIA